MSTYSNKTVYGIENVNARCAWAGYFLFVVASSLIGDTVILIASIKYKVFKLHKVIVVIIQHIAVCDLMVSLMDILPRFVSLIAGEWVFGGFLCYLNPCAKYYFNSASLLLICTMTTCKLLLIKSPLHFGTTTFKRAHLFCLACWLAALTSPTTALFVNWKDISLSYRDYACEYNFSLEIWRWLKPVLGTPLILVPTCVVVATTVWLLVIARKVARRHRESLKWQGITTTSLTAIIYCISILPTAMYGARVFLDRSKLDSVFFTHLYRLGVTFMTLNTISNFYIYSLTVDSFRAFVWSRMQMCYQFFTNIETFTSHGEKKKLTR